MSVYRRGISHLPPFKEFEDKFRQAFGRELTREERRFYRLVNIVLEESEVGLALVDPDESRAG